ncbi:MAG: heme-binding protein [Sphingomonadales bacterium]|nr:MAG: heme-binding protein [Sphingomonadales bacterium]
MSSGTTLWLAAALLSAAPPTAAQHRQTTVSLPLANELASATIAACRAIGQSAVVAVVDRGGNLIALQRGDDVGPHNTIAAQRKAFTALSTKTATRVLAERAASDPTSRNLTSVPELLLLGGGVPIVLNGETIGAVGVAGAGGSLNDERCATQAISQSAQLRIRPGR